MSINTRAEKPKVFIIQQPRPDPKRNNWVPNFDSAADFGAIHFVFDQNERVHADPVASRVKAEEALKDFSPNRDYLLPTVFGDPAAAWLVIQLLTAQATYCQNKFLKYLYWSRGRGEGGMTNETGYYVECKIPV